ncbi:MAG: TonB family protein [Xanthomonadales bacterium]|nr:TonB family protein [Xanthomonadales bacterium]MCB1593654.1 TonB family protein [Xanthomonadales bacterium]
MRYSTSSLVAVFFSLFTFLLMAVLIAQPTQFKSSNIEMINFSMIQEIKAPETTVTPPNVIPEHEVNEHPPTPPTLEITENGVGSRIEINPNDNNRSTFDNIFNKPVLEGPVGTKPGDLAQSSSLTEVLPVQPKYPVVAMQDKIEGWVKVEFTVNEFGGVENIHILDSQPKRVFDQSIKQALLKSKFKPMKIDGQAVSQQAVKTYEFKLDE